MDSIPNLKLVSDFASRKAAEIRKTLRDSRCLSEICTVTSRSISDPGKKKFSIVLNSKTVVVLCDQSDRFLTSNNKTLIKGQSGVNDLHLEPTCNEEISFFSVLLSHSLLSDSGFLTTRFGRSFYFPAHMQR
jgi:hypothetical protein